MNLDDTLKPSLIFLLFSFFLALPFVYLLCTRVAPFSAPFNGMLFKKKKKKIGASVAVLGAKPQT